MSKLHYDTLLNIVQSSFNEDIYEYLSDEQMVADDAGLAIENPILYHLLSRLYDTYEPEDTNGEKLDRLASIVSDVRDILDLIDQSIENWEDYVDSRDNDF